MTNSTEGTRTCGYPGCGRAAQASTGPGRPPEYCEDPEHTALRAWRARHAAGRAEQQQPDDLGRPVSMAAARGSALRDELVRTVTQMQDQLSRVMADMHTLGDPDAAAAQIETVTVEATQRIASSDAARVAAETAARQARELAEQADTAAAELDTQLQQARAEVAELGEQAEQTHAQLAAAEHRAGELAAELQQLTAERDQAERQVADLTGRLDAAVDRSGQLATELTQTTQRADQAETDRDAARAKAEQLAAQLAAAEAQHTATTAELAGTRDQLSAATTRAADAEHARDRAETDRATAEQARRDTDTHAARLQAELVAAQAAAERERQTAQQRVDDLTRTYTTQLDHAHTQLAAATNRADRLAAELAETGARATEPGDQRRRARRTEPDPPK